MSSVITKSRLGTVTDQAKERLASETDPEVRELLEGLLQAVANRDFDITTLRERSESMRAALSALKEQMQSEILYLSAVLDSATTQAARLRASLRLRWYELDDLRGRHQRATERLAQVYGDAWEVQCHHCGTYVEFGITPEEEV